MLRAARLGRADTRSARGRRKSQAAHPRLLTPCVFQGSEPFVLRSDVHILCHERGASITVTVLLLKQAATLVPEELQETSKMPPLPR